MSILVGEIRSFPKACRRPLPVSTYFASRDIPLSGVRRIPSVQELVNIVNLKKRYRDLGLAMRMEDLSFVLTIPWPTSRHCHHRTDRCW